MTTPAQKKTLIIGCHPMETGALEMGMRDLGVPTHTLTCSEPYQLADCLAYMREHGSEYDAVIMAHAGLFSMTRRSAVANHWEAQIKEIPEIQEWLQQARAAMPNARAVVFDSPLSFAAGWKDLPGLGYCTIDETTRGGIIEALHYAADVPVSAEQRARQTRLVRQ